MIQKELEKELIVAGLLSQFERFYGELDSFLQEFKPLLSKYMNVEKLRAILLEPNNQETAALHNILLQAQKISLNESDKSYLGKIGNKRLTSVFARVRDTEDNQTFFTKKVKYPFKRYSVVSAFPKQEEEWLKETGIRAKENSLENLKGEFQNEMRKLVKYDTENRSFQHFLVIFDALLKKYLWCISSSDYEGEDISLYHHAKMTTAIVNCLNESDNKEQPFILIGGAFSGIQKYIFAVSNLTENGVEKRLRARSFYVDMAVSIAATKILEHFGLPSAHSLLCTGGKFYLLLPAYEGIMEELEKLEKTIEEELFYKFEGQVVIYLTWMNMGESGLENYSTTIVALLNQLKQKKYNTLKRILQNENKWNEDKFVISEDLKDKKMCPACRTALMDNVDRICHICQEQTKIGVRLPSTRYIVVSHKKEKGFFEIMDRYYIGLLEKIEDLRKIEKESIIEVQKINSVEPLQKEDICYPVTLRFMANNIPITNKNEMKTFSEIAEESEGIKRIAVLKADVDNLGFLFAEGLRVKQRHFGTISRVNTLSGLLETFFSGYVNKIIKEEYPNIYSVFSGGDDLFLLGPWNIMAELAWTLEEKFREFTGKNSAFTLSATISIFQPREWVAHMAEESEKSLKRVKNSGNPYIHPEKEGRNGVSFMQEIYSWNELKEQLKNGNQLTQLIQEDKLCTAQMHRMVQYSTMYRNIIMRQEIEGYRYAPMLYYDMSRNYHKNQRQELHWFFEEYMKGFEEAAKEGADLNVNLFFAESIISYALYKSKEYRRS